MIMTNSNPRYLLIHEDFIKTHENIGFVKNNSNSLKSLKLLMYYEDSKIVVFKYIEGVLIDAGYKVKGYGEF